MLYWPTQIAVFEPLKAALLKVGLSLGYFCNGPPIQKIGLNTRICSDAILPEICPPFMSFT